MCVECAIIKKRNSVVQIQIFCSFADYEILKSIFRKIKNKRTNLNGDGSMDHHQFLLLLKRLILIRALIINFNFYSLTAFFAAKFVFFFFNEFKKYRCNVERKKKKKSFERN